MLPLHVEGDSICAWTTRVVEYARGELGRKEREAFGRHLDECSTCAAELADVTEQIAALGEAARSSEAWAWLEPRPGLSARVVARVSASQRGLVRSPAAIRRLVACSVLLGAFALLYRVSLRQPPSSPVARAATWLVAAQEPAGAWDPARWGGKAEYRVGVSSLVLLALAGANVPGSEAAVSKGTRFLLENQSEDGLFGPEFHGTLYNHAIATYALLRTRREANDEPCRHATEKAISYLLEKQSPQGGWGYLAGAMGSGNASVTIWPLQALVLARSTGREGLSGAIDRASLWLEKFAEGGGSLSWSPGGEQDHLCGAGSAAAFQAIAALLREKQVRQKPAATSPALRRAVDGVARGLGTRFQADDPYRCYLVSWILSAVDSPPLRGLTERAKQALTGRQVAVGPLAGSWEPSDRWSSAGGRLCTTALAALALEGQEGRL